MESGKKVPWKDWEEWRKCWKLLKESPFDALELLNMWAISEPLPVRIECTRTIFSCLKELTNNPNPASLLTLKGEVPKLAISMVITRCTNLIMDLYNDCKYARSVSNTARSIKYPDFLVDLRHDATHSSLPSMFLLSKAINALINWLYEEYWSKQNNHLIEKTEKVLQDIEKFEKRARVTQETYTLAKFAEGLFNQKIECHKTRIGRIIAELRWKMNDEAWALMFLQLNSKNKKFAENVLQGVFWLLKYEKINATKAKSSVEEILTLYSSPKLSYTPWVKNLLLLQNSDIVAFEIVSMLISHNGFDESIMKTIVQVHEATVFSNSKNEILEISDIEVKKWRKLGTWCPRPIGSSSVYNDVEVNTDEVE
ncbi:hypothetical protein SteCoe_31544 [Stentor coeruleus]|uniref:Uncharacterized protein n=1 Tax=Stentor coeruleus TaxID=5963 RepID=A0A1R2B133_9CILI|nr:hypothetical protein SteCoe_31544 [Stentor coeruleus]